MKKVLLFLVAMICISNVFAQNKPEKGSFGTEIQFNPFAQDGNMFKLDALKLRYFLTDNDALRLKLGFAVGSQKYDDDAYEAKGKTGDFNLDLGYERHFNLKGRLDLYAGAQIGIYKHFASASTSIDQGSSTQDEEWSNMLPDENGDIIDRAYFGFATSVFTGLDFYVYKGLYVGTELGLYIKTHKTNEGEHTSGNHSNKYKDTTRTTTCKFDIEPTLRLGWTF